MLKNEIKNKDAIDWAKGGLGGNRPSFVINSVCVLFSVTFECNEKDKSFDERYKNSILSGCRHETVFVSIEKQNGSLFKL